MSSQNRFGPFDVFESVGAGGMATVHRATIDRDGVTREVALKRLLPELQHDAAFVRDFIREAKMATQLDHPNIVRVFELGCVDGIYYIAMELLRGAPLMQILRRSGQLAVPMPIHVILSIVIELADALDYAQNGLDEYGERFDLLHRDVSPSNVFVADDGHAKIIDFGVAKALTGRFVTQSGLAKGKLGYMSSEAIAAESLDARADLFSVGVVAWEMITGRRLFPVTDDYLPPRTDVVRPPSVFAPSCPRALDAIVLRALAPERDDRWPTAAALRRALEDVRTRWPEPATPLEVAAWLDALLGRTETRQSPRLPTETGTSTRLRTADIVDVLDAGFAIDEAPTADAAALDARFDATPFDADDRSALGEASPFVGDDAPPAERGLDVAHRLARARLSFDPEPTEPSKEMIVTREGSVPPPPPDPFGLESAKAFDVRTTQATPWVTRETELDDARTAESARRAFPPEKPPRRRKKPTTRTR